MNKIKQYITGHFEKAFVLIVVVGVSLITYFIPYKLAFLDFYFIPVVLAAYYLDMRQALLGAFFCALIVSIYAHFFPGAFAYYGKSSLDLPLNLVTWAGFLILNAAVVANLQGKLRTEVLQTRALNEELRSSKEQLEQAGRAVLEYSENLERKVEERTESIEESRRVLKSLKDKVEDALHSTMDPALAKLIIEGRLRTEKRKITVMFCDLVGFTGFSEDRQPETVIADLNQFLGSMESVLSDFRGHIDKYTGDGIMVEFGAPLDYERHALQGVAAGVKMQEKMTGARLPLPLRIGISSGDPIVGLIGRRRQTYTAIGDVVNLAARLQELTTPGGVTIDEATYEQVSAFFECGRKTIFPFNQLDDPEYVQTAEKYIGQLDENPKDMEVLKKLGFLLHYGKDFVQSREYLQRALELDPEDERVKVAYAEASLQVERMGQVAVRGKKRRLHLYDVKGFRDPLKRPSVPERLADEYRDRLRTLAEYPEDMILPVECLDGCVGHSRVVGLLSYALADALQLSGPEKKDILVAAYLGDVGKAAVPHHLLNRAGSLSRIEFEEVKKHCADGVRILEERGETNKSVLDIVLHHHEAYGGGGYPDGLAGEAISIGARILAVVDEYDSLTSWRPYRDAWEPRAAFNQIEEDTRRGKFDPQVTYNFAKMLGFGV